MKEKQAWRDRILYIFGVVIAVLFFAFQVNQLLSFNPYWGYDGGAHVHILETLLFERRIPSLEENYLAWHEPFYYLVLVGFGFLSVPFWVSHLLIVAAIDVLVFTLWRRMGFSVGYALVGALATLGLPAFLEVGMFFTNEALNYVFVLAIIHLALTMWREEKWSWKSAVLLALCVGLGVVTKITALVAFGVTVILLIIKMIRIRKDKKEVLKYIGTILFTGAFAVVCYAPWYAVRSNGLSQASINNYDMLPAKPLMLDERVQFMTTFDANIFLFPFWYSGGTGFWSMLYADTVSDYLGIFEHQDRKNALPEEDRVLTTHNGNFVSAYRKPLATWALRLGFIPVGIMIVGVIYAFAQLIKEKGKAFSDALPVLGFFSAFLLALMYYAYRYPYYDQGVVKSIFIAPAFVLPLAMGMRGITKLPWGVQGMLFVGWGAYIVVVLMLFFIN